MWAPRNSPQAGLAPPSVINVERQTTHLISVATGTRGATNAGGIVTQCKAGMRAHLVAHDEDLVPETETLVVKEDELQHQDGEYVARMA